LRRLERSSTSKERELGTARGGRGKLGKEEWGERRSKRGAQEFVERKKKKILRRGKRPRCLQKKEKENAVDVTARKETYDRLRRRKKK